MILYWRKDGESYRVWNEEQSKYGMFEVFSDDNFRDLKDQILMFPKDSFLAKFVGPIILKEADDA